MVEMSQKDSDMDSEAQSKREIVTLKDLIRQQHIHQLGWYGDYMAPFLLQQAVCDNVTPDAHVTHRGLSELQGQL